MRLDNKFNITDFVYYDGEGCYVIGLCVIPCYDTYHWEYTIAKPLYGEAEPGKWRGIGLSVDMTVLEKIREHQLESVEQVHKRVEKELNDKKEKLEREMLAVQHELSNMKAQMVKNGK